MGVQVPMRRGNFEGEGRPIVKYREGNTVHVLRRCGLLSNNLSISVHFDHQVPDSGANTQWRVQSINQSINLFAIKGHRPLTYHTNSTNIHIATKRKYKIMPVMEIK